jgi:hypothetical protein
VKVKRKREVEVRGVVIPAAVIVCASGTVERATVGGGTSVVYKDGRSIARLNFPADVAAPITQTRCR